MITIYIPNYNEEESIERCIDSCCSQNTNYPYEVIVIDDCSTDDSFNIANKLTKKYKNLQVFQNQEKSTDWQFSASQHFNKFRGQHIISLGADDVLISNMVEMTSSFINEPIIFFNVAVTDSDLNIKTITIHGYPHTISLLPHQIKPRFQHESFPITESGGGSSIRKDVLQWLLNLEVWKLGPWGDSLGYSAAAVKFGATYVPIIGSAFVKYHKNGKISYGADDAQSEETITNCSIFAKTFFKNAGIDDDIASKIIVKKNLILI